MPLEGRRSARHAELDCKFYRLTRDIHMYVIICINVKFTSAVLWIGINLI